MLKVTDTEKKRRKKDGTPLFGGYGTPGMNYRERRGKETLGARPDDESRLVKKMGTILGLVNPCIIAGWATGGIRVVT